MCRSQSMERPLATVGSVHGKNVDGASRCVIVCVCIAIGASVAAASGWVAAGLSVFFLMHGCSLLVLAVANIILLCSDQTPKELAPLTKAGRWRELINRLCRVRCAALSEVCCKADCRLRPCTAWPPFDAVDSESRGARSLAPATESRKEPQAGPIEQEASTSFENT